MEHTKELLKELKDFELYILPKYDDYMEQERNDDIEYGTGINYHDDLASFYAWLDMLSWGELKILVEEYANEKSSIK